MPSLIKNVPLQSIRKKNMSAQVNNILSDSFRGYAKNLMIKV